MTARERLLSLRNTVDFVLRSLLRWGRRVDPQKLPRVDARVQGEIREFLDCFDPKVFVPLWDIVACDVGARNFATGPVIDDFFAKLGISAEIHGIEIDAFRRLADLRTRADYGYYYARQMRRGFFHPTDFLRWDKQVDVAFVLNPFVTMEPLLDWGLPGRLFTPEKFFDHLVELIKPTGLMVLSAPNEEEFAEALKLASERGFLTLQTVRWEPRADSAQRKPRLGVILRR